MPWWLLVAWFVLVVGWFAVQRVAFGLSFGVTTICAVKKLQTQPLAQTSKPATQKKFQLQLQPAAWQATMLLQVEAAWWKKEREEEMRQSTQMGVEVEAVVGIAEEGRQGQEVEVEAEAEAAG